MPGRQRGQILLVAIHIHHRVGRHIFRVAAGKDVLALWRIGLRKFIWRDLESVGNLSALRRIDPRIDAERRRSSQEIVLPDIRRNHRDGATGMHPNLTAARSSQPERAAPSRSIHSGSWAAD